VTVLALIGSASLWLLYLWLGSAIVSGYLAERKGYGQKPGLAAGMLLVVIGVVIWLIVPAKPNSRWREEGALPKRRRTERVAEARAETGSGAKEM
jgi:hypothetical protein